MTVKFDDAKSQDEQSIERVSDILSRTIPEQTEDAMGDYVAVLAILKKCKDWRTKPLLTLTQRVYVYPNRSEHNELVSEVNDLKETLLEERIQRVLTAKEASKHSKKFLGEGAKNYSIWHIAVVVALGYLILG